MASTDGNISTMPLSTQPNTLDPIRFNQIVHTLQTSIPDLPLILTELSKKNNINPQRTLEKIVNDLIAQLNLMCSKPIDDYSENERHIAKLNVEIDYVKELYIRNIGGLKTTITEMTNKYNNCLLRSKQIENDIEQKQQQLNNLLLEQSIRSKIPQNQPYIQTVPYNHQPLQSDIKLSPSQVQKPQESQTYNEHPLYNESHNTIPITTQSHTNDQMSDTENEISYLRNELDQLYTKNSTLQTERDHFEKTINELKTSINEQGHRVIELQKNNVEKFNERNELKYLLQIINPKSTEDDIEKMKSQIRLYLKNAAKLKDTVMKLERDLITSNSNYNLKTAELATATQEFQQKLDQDQQVIKNLEAQQTLLNQQVIRITNDTTRIVNMHNNTSTEILKERDSYLNQIAFAQEERDNAKQQNAELITQNNALRQTINDAQLNQNQTQSNNINVLYAQIKSKIDKLLQEYKANEITQPNFINNILTVLYNENISFDTPSNIMNEPEPLDINPINDIQPINDNINIIDDSLRVDDNLVDVDDVILTIDESTNDKYIQDVPRTPGRNIVFDFNINDINNTNAIDTQINPLDEQEQQFQPESNQLLDFQPLFDIQPSEQNVNAAVYQSNNEYLNNETATQIDKVYVEQQSDEIFVQEQNDNQESFITQEQTIIQEENIEQPNTEIYNIDDSTNEIVVIDDDDENDDYGSNIINTNNNNDTINDATNIPILAQFTALDNTNLTQITPFDDTNEPNISQITEFNDTNVPMLAQITALDDSNVPTTSQITDVNDTNVPMLAQITALDDSNVPTTSQITDVNDTNVPVLAQFTPLVINSKQIPVRGTGQSYTKTRILDSSQIKRTKSKNPQQKLSEETDTAEETAEYNNSDRRRKINKKLNNTNANNKPTTPSKPINVITENSLVERIRNTPKKKSNKNIPNNSNLSLAELVLRNVKSRAALSLNVSKYGKVVKRRQRAQKTSKVSQKKLNSANEMIKQMSTTNENTTTTTDGGITKRRYNKKSKSQVITIN
ncbi:hypothetical protein [Esparto virus]|uniref:Uncharacterized protein n=1 Tax=Esparto virus TaxID=2072209 RepID=A0A2I7G2T3_9VIRU|nr:hypothetical protein [Esparto virus]AUQ43939.1 hypothetical protein [Esparto virus]